MPPNQKITKEMVVEASYQLVKESGVENLNSRNIAAKIGCSTQPVFSQFPKMEALKYEVLDYACKKLEAEILAESNGKFCLQNSYRKLIALAKQSPNVFKLIYLSDFCKGKSFIDMRMDFTTNQRILEEILEKYHMTEAQGKDVLERMSLFVHGIATLLATTEISYEDNQIFDLIERTLNDMTSGFTKE